VKENSEKKSEKDITKDTNNENAIKINSEGKAPDWLKGNLDDIPKQDNKIEDNKEEEQRKEEPKKEEILEKEPEKEENLEEVTKIDDSKIPDWLK
jgi:hypothetical protein